VTCAGTPEKPLTRINARNPAAQSIGLPNWRLEDVMAVAAKVPVKSEQTTTPALHIWRPFESLRREIDRLFDDFDGAP
jgi:hypothetical protein